MAKRLSLSGTAVFMSCNIFYDIYFQNNIWGSLLKISGDVLAGCPMIIGATAIYSLGIPSCSLSSGVLSDICAKPIQQLPKPSECAASIMFCAAKVQSQEALGPSVLAKVIINAGAL